MSSPSWPTRWRSDSFAAGRTAGFLLLLAGLTVVTGFVAIVAVGIWLGVTHQTGAAEAAMQNQANMSASVFIAVSLAQIVTEIVMVAAILFALPRLTGFSLRQIGFWSPNAATVGYALAGAVLMILVADVGSSLISSWRPHAVQPQIVEKIFEHIRSQPGGTLFFALFAIVVQPIAEETIFRVLAFNIALRYSNFAVAALISGGLFGATHVLLHDADAISGALLAVGGVILCWVYYRSRNAYASMISHGLFNAASFFALYFFPKLAGG
jgi:membrane protease YdiL (CAAX protease family)